MLHPRQQKLLDGISFSGGQIVRIKLENFVTYDAAELFPKPKMNMITGPNGTGKSTFLCAIVIGLGGKPNIIGRSPNVADYIKRGCDSAFIELELFNPDGTNHIVVRKFNGSSSQWYLNKKCVPFSKIEELINHYNISINNLCQVLPQDRVQDFAKMDKKQLLDATQKAIGSTQLYETFVKMKQNRALITSNAEGLADKKKKYEQEYLLLKRMEGEIKTYEEKQVVLKKIDMMRKKESWLMVEEKNKARTEMKKAVQEVQKSYEDLKQKLAPLQRAVKNEENKEAQINNKIECSEKTIGELNGSLRDLNKKISSVRGKIDDLVSDLERRLNEQATKKDRVAELEQRIEAAKVNEPATSEQSLKTEIRLVEIEIERLKKHMSQIRFQESEMDQRLRVAVQTVRANEQKLSQITTIIDKKIDLLSAFPDAHTAYQWLTTNRNKFSGAVYGPMFVELNVQSSDKAKYLEQVIPFRDLMAFACEEVQDVTLLLKLLRDQKGLKINVVHAPAAEYGAKESYSPHIPLSQLKPLGFSNYLLELVEGPDSILHYLCRHYRLHDIPMGTATVDDNITNIPSKIRQYFSKERVYRVSQSRFSSEIMRVVDYVGQGKFLAFSVNQDRIDSLKKQLHVDKAQQSQMEDELSQLTAKRQQLEIEGNQAKNNKREVARRLEAFVQRGLRLEALQRELKQVQDTIIDPEDERLKTRTQIRKCFNDQINLEKEVQKVLNKSWEVRLLLRIQKREAEIASWRIREKQKESRGVLRETEQTKRALDDKLEVFSRLRAETSRLLAKAKELTDGLSPDDREFAVRFKESFKTLPSDLNDLLEAIAEAEATAQCLGDAVSARMVKDYEERKKVLLLLEKEVNAIETNRESIKQQCAELMDVWNPIFGKLLNKINEKFEKCFSFLGCSGTVELDRTDDPTAVENYGLNIRVKFRNEGELQTLNAYTQSGGERSLSTAIFLLSIQNVINVPFRIVDEINQGMDEQNEVRAYYLILAAVAEEQKAQYFLISPKFSCKMKISIDFTLHCINCGFMESRANQEDGLDANGDSWTKKFFFKHLERSE